MCHSVLAQVGCGVTLMLALTWPFCAGAAEAADPASAPQTAGATPPNPPVTASPPLSAGGPPPSAGPSAANTLLGDMGGLRTWLGGRGITLNLDEISEVMGNATGGSGQAADYDGLTEASIQVDSAAALGYAGGLLDVSALQFHGRSLASDTLLDLENMSNIQADRAIRLWELWYQQKFSDTLDIRIGEQSIDQEFIANTNAAIFASAAFGWPLVPSADMPAGAAVYPLAALGVRVHAVPVAGVAILAGVFNGSPVAKGCVGDPQKCNPSGTSFPLDGDQLVIAEVQYTPPAKATGTYRLGFWVDTENFADRRFDTTGVPLASPHSNGIAQIHHDDWSIYGLLDQVLWQSRGDATALSGFLRAMGAPADRNLIGFSLDAGLALKAPLPDRVHDTAGIGVGYGRVSSAVRAFDLDAQRFGTGSFARSDETLVEATYQLLPRPWWQVQPDLQYVFNPGGGTADPNDPSRRLRNELILSLRTNITF